MVRRVLSFLLLVLWTVPALAAGPTEGLLWRIEKPGTAPSHLFGTMHSSDPRVVDVAPEVTAALEGSQRFVGEVILSQDVMAEAMKLTIAEKPLVQEVGDILFARTANALGKRGIPDTIVNKLRPWAAATMLMVPPGPAGPVLDMVLQNRAKARDIPLAGLETATEQVKAFTGLPLSAQILLLESALAIPTDYHEDLRRLYLDRDIGGLLERYRRDLEDDSIARRTAAPPEAVVALKTAIIGIVDGRNRRMADRMVFHLERGGAFVAVGALHLPGDGGLIRLLEGKGYGVRRAW